MPRISPRSRIHVLATETHDRLVVLRTTKKREVKMSNLKEALAKAMEIDGAIGVALADYASGMCLGVAGGRANFNLEVAAAGNSEVVRAKIRVMTELGLDDQIQDILITLGKEYHIIFILPGTSLFLYMALGRERANLAMARHKISEIMKSLKV